MKEVLKMGVIGVGFFGSKHAIVIKQLANAELTCICDVNEEIAKEAAKRYGCEYYTDYKEMLAKGDIDAVSICVSEDYHCETAIASAEAGKHILLEKPIATNYEDALKIKEAAKKNDVRLMVAHILKWDGKYAYTERAIEAGELGDIISMSFTRAVHHETSKSFNGRVSFYHYTIVHDIEYMLTYAWPAKVVKVYSQWTNKRNKSYNSQDTAFNIFTFDDGTIACVQVCWSLPVNSARVIEARAEILGTKGVSYINGSHSGLEIIKERVESEIPNLTAWPEYNNEIRGMLYDEIDHFVSSTLKGGEYLVCTDRAIEAVRMIDACFESLRTGLPVDL